MKPGLASSSVISTGLAVEMPLKEVIGEQSVVLGGGGNAEIFAAVSVIF